MICTNKMFIFSSKIRCGVVSLVTLYFVEVENRFISRATTRFYVSTAREKGGP